MTGILWLLPVIWVWICISCYMLYRNGEVFKYRNQLLGDLHEAAKSDMRQGRNHEWRYKEFEAITYDEMVIKFWKPLNSFYSDMAFTESRQTEGDDHEVAA